MALRSWRAQLPLGRAITDRLCFKLVLTCIFHLRSWQILESHKLLFSESFFAHEHKMYVLNLEMVQ